MHHDDPACSASGVVSVNPAIAADMLIVVSCYVCHECYLFLVIAADVWPSLLSGLLKVKDASIRREVQASLFQICETFTRAPATCVVYDKLLRSLLSSLDEVRACCGREPARA